MSAPFGLRATSVAVCASVGLASCSHYDAQSLVNPYVSSTPVSANIATGDPREELIAARKAAGDSATKYLAAVRTAAYTKNVGFMALVLAAGDAFYLRSIKGAQATNRLVTGVAAAGGVAYAANAALLPRDRTTIYLNGLDAIDCAIGHSSPYVINQTDYDQFLTRQRIAGFASGTSTSAVELRTAMQQAADFKATLAAEVARVDPGKPTAQEVSEFNSEQARLTALIDVARSTLADAESLAGDLQTVRSRVESAALVLRNDVRRVERTVDRQLASIELSGTDMRALLTNFTPMQLPASSGATRTTPPAVPSAPSASVLKLAAQATSPSRMLRDSILGAEKDIAQARAFLAEIDKRERAVPTGGCEVAALVAFMVTPLGNPELIPGGKFSIQVIAPAAPQAQVLGGSDIVADVVTTQPPVAGLSGHYQVNLTANGTLDIKTTPRKVVISSGGNSETVQVVLKAAPP